jgi:hypothetical protein
MTTDPKSAVTPMTDDRKLKAKTEKYGVAEYVLAVEYAELERELYKANKRHADTERELSRCREELERLQGDSIELRRAVVQAKAERDDAEERLATHAEREEAEPIKRCEGRVCRASAVDGIICAENECDYASGVRKPTRMEITGYADGKFIRTPVPAPSAASGLADALGKCELHITYHGKQAFHHGKILVPEALLANVIYFLRSHQAPVGEDVAHSFSAVETDRHLLGEYTPTSYPYGYPWYLNLTMLRRAGDVVLTVRASPVAWGKDAKTSSVRFTREMWREFAKLFESANKIYEAADSLDAEL